ncbi:hypothetical protein QR680_018603 [Steinernema hermaphroditum]|uniref:TIL domain-containing protein n=1 Tax=Steinernema hermaphroditum TaxID=289476 RepID=A0AA39LRA0_9BILA|nr:hypothetical protein QR680_018603 [Steinernema hermaphroditum]
MVPSVLILGSALLLVSSLALSIPAKKESSDVAWPPSNITCGQNEQFTNCGFCQQRCEYPYGSPGQACPLVCGQMCICKEGYVRGWDNKCIKKSQCKPHPQCVYVYCPKGTRCVWAPDQCPDNDPTCLQVTCMKPFDWHN